jgi:DNA topoisomerase-2
MMDGSDFSHTPPSAKKQKKAPAAKKATGKPLEPVENMNVDGTAEKKDNKDHSEKYQKLTQLEHIILRPDTYIGSVERIEDKMWVFNSETELMEMRKVSYVPGLFKIFDEILVNAADNKQNDPNMKFIKVSVDKEKGEFVIENDGRGIPIQIHKTENIYIPEMIFGHLLTGSNYNDNDARTTGGRNGYGAKLCNIFSTEFTIETQDSESGKRYKQTWKDNMSSKSKAKITASKSSDFTRITFYPDWKKFGMDGLDDDLEAIFKRRVYDMAGTVKGVSVYLNGTKLKINNFKKYIEMYVKAVNKERGVEEMAPNSIILDDNDAHKQWEVGFAVSDGSFQQVSFVNSVATTSGGTHVNYVANQITGRLMDLIKKKNAKGASLKENQIRNHIFLFVNCLIVNPNFNSQTKEQMTTKQSQFGSKCQLTEEFLKKIAKTEVVENILHFAQQKADKELAKSDGNKRSRMNNPKLVDANLAGTKRGHECTLILTEGDSAKGLAVAGRAILDPDRIGVFPLRGKLLNVRDASIDQISKNAEIQNIKQFLGLKHKQTYTDTKGLRYGHLMIMADQDHDGSHIKGLLINFLQVQFPSLLKIPDFFREFITPIVKVWKGNNPKKLDGVKWFFTMPQYEEWKARHAGERGWQHKYFKGLGTSTNQDAQVYFTNLDEHLKEFKPMKQEEEDLFELAFSKKKADARKAWLGNFVPGTFLDHSTKQITYDDFVNRELILFSMADNLRSIPSVVDGLKPGQRKVLYACFNRNLIKDTKVVELAGYCSELTAYHHGEASLHQTIIGLAQDFVGSNNVNCLEPSGNFGSRLAGGSDSASPRYIFTRLSPFARRIFSPLDDPTLTYNTDDDKPIEPTVYAPVVPMILLNGADGIGTGWSTSIPNYHPIDVVNNLKRRMGRLDEGDDEEKPFEPMKPWFRGWKGTVEEAGPMRYNLNGIARQVGDSNEVEITELPIRVWTDDFKARLEEVIKAEKAPSFIKDYQEFNDHTSVHFVIQMDEKHMQAALKEGLEERFKLNKTIATSNLVAFDTQGRIHKYEKVEDIMEEFYHHRIQKYTERKAHWLNVYGVEYRKLSNQARFVTEIIEGKLVVSKKAKAKLVDELRKKGYEAFPKVADAKKRGETDDVVENTDEVSEDEVAGARDYDYLLGLPIWSLTQERVDKLHKQMQGKKNELDELKALSEKDLWCRDLDDFVATWNARLAEEQEISKKIRGLGRRVSRKIGAGKSSKVASRMTGDDDYAPQASKSSAPKLLKSSAAKGIIKVEPEKSSQKFLNNFLGKAKPKPKPKADAEMFGTDGASDLSDDDFAALSKPTSARASVEPAAGGRSQRAAAAKPKNWVVDDESDSDGDKFLGDVGDMVKGINTGTTDSGAANGRLSLFSMSGPAGSGRPSSSNGLLNKGKAKAKAEDSDNDETNYEMLASPRKTVPTTSTNIDSFLSDDDDLALTVPATKPTSSKVVPKPAKAPIKITHDDDGDSALPIAAPIAKSSKPTVKAAPKPASKPTIRLDSDSDDDLSAPSAAPAAKKITKPAAPKAKPAAVPRKPSGSAAAAAKPAEPKPVHLSPAAKAYALKQNKLSLKPAAKKSVYSEDEDEDVDMDASEMSPPAKPKPAAKAKAVAAKPAAKPKATAAAAAAKKRVVVSDDEDEDVDMEDASESPQPVKKRAARAAVVNRKKPVYAVDSEDEDEDVSYGGGAGEGSDDFEESY